jgi:hypothetical protein
MGLFNIFRRFARSPAGKDDVRSILENTKQLETSANTKEKVRALITAYESVLAIEPSNRIALASLRSYCFLMAHRYDGDANEKASYYMKSIQYSERLLSSNRGFKATVGNGAKQGKGFTN